MSGEGARAAYAAALRVADECAHGQIGGDLIRPWCGSPACALCRRRGWFHWRDIDGPAYRRPPAHVVPINGSRRLW